MSALRASVGLGDGSPPRAVDPFARNSFFKSVEITSVGKSEEFFFSAEDSPTTPGNKKRGAKKYTVYTINIATETGLGWVIQKRYSDFGDLRQFLFDTGAEAGRTLEFPPKKVFGRRSEKNVDLRKNLLQAWLQTVSHVLWQQPVLHGFLCTPHEAKMLWAFDHISPLKLNAPRHIWTLMVYQNELVEFDTRVVIAGDTLANMQFQLAERLELVDKPFEIFEDCGNGEDHEVFSRRKFTVNLDSPKSTHRVLLTPLVRAQPEGEVAAGTAENKSASLGFTTEAPPEPQTSAVSLNPKSALTQLPALPSTLKST